MNTNNMPAASGKRLTLVWAILSAITLAQLLVLMTDSPGHINPNVLATFSIILISLFKVRLIIREFMEVKSAPSWLRWGTDIWLATTAVSLLGTYAIGIR